MSPAPNPKADIPGASIVRLVITTYGQAAFGLVAVLIMGAAGLYAFQAVIVPQLTANREERDKLQGMATAIERASENIEAAAAANRDTALVLKAVTEQLVTLVRDTARERSRQ